jgi:C_GCAxxG_C_C family probable redox protein
MTDPIQSSKVHFARGLNCSQAVFAAFASRHGLSEEVALKIASAFGGGIARQGQICGAVTGALMALGLERGNTTPEGKEETYRISAEYLRRFKESHGTVLCRELTGYDISTAEGLTEARRNNAFAAICPVLVEDASRLLDEFLKE